MSRYRAILPHLVWEGVLFLVLLVAVLVVTATGDLFRGSFVWFNLANVGLLASAFALSLRTATPNLAIGGIAVLTGCVYAKLTQEDWSGVLAGVAAVALALLIGLVLGVLTGLTSAPAWAVTLGGLAITQAATYGLTDGLVLPLGSGPPGTGTAVLWTLLLLVISIGGGLLWQVPAVRAALGASRTPADLGGDKVRFQPSRLVGALVGIGGSSVLAALAGLVIVSYLAAAAPGDDGGRLLIAIGAALLGGVSVFGGRGGIAGTVLASAVLVVANHGLIQTEAPRWMTIWLISIVAILLGVLVSRTLEALRPNQLT
ncbi:hypothetical protein [Phytohabitans rumicis]|uniref:Ribose ABC transporter permease n=1 Tax=Phytohabitans rumicis TaxID=1076125 RepID=A0A6V8LQD0_9ACTN|nr:hypothetical protein [Phytohabitans rumicis]GFJ96317.1 ribose ABC transporter permease [Phytohabitans rumicis]